MVNLNNLEIRQMIYDNGLNNKEVADEMGVIQQSFSRLLSKKLSERKEEEVLAAIKRCIGKKTQVSK